MFWIAISIFLVSAVKFMAGVLMATGAVPNQLFAAILCTAGAVFGIVVFTYGEGWLNEHVFRKYLFKNGKRMNRRNRMLVRLKHSGGLPLVAILTPILLTIPVGCILATTFIHDRKKILVYMIAASLFWTALFFGGPWLFGINPALWIRSHL